ncbi:MAG: hypothetical protein KAW46_05480 [candidate division Zixibacteria bacterium]|nr:hypothetical protein [candidate division Zixibacteria bacterium]
MALNQYLSHWFWRPTHTPLPLWWLIIPILAVSVGAVFLIKMTSFRPCINLLALILIGFAVQQGFALMEGRGINGIRDRMLHTGHALFAVEAVKQPNMLRVARHYQTLVETGELEVYPNATKPPGQLLFYMATERMSRLLPWASDNMLERMATFASFFWPLLSYFTLVPLYLLSRLYLDPKQAYVPCILYLCMPPVALITLHLDQCLYPFLFVTTVALFVHGVRLKKTALLFCAGVTTSVAVFVSFSLVILLPFIFLILALEVIPRVAWGRTGNSENRRQLLAHAALRLICYLSGAALVQGVFFLLLNYNVFENYRFSMSIHQGFRIEEWPLRTIVYIGCLDLLEFAIWSGGAVVSLAAVYAVRSCRRLQPSDDSCKPIVVSFCAVLLAMAFMGSTVAETARLWIFLTPLITLFASKELIAVFGLRSWFAAGTLAVLQVLNIFGIKMWQDFF